MSINKKPDYVTELAPGKVFMDYGPVSMVIAAWQNGKPLTNECFQAANIATGCLAEISAQLSKLKQPWRCCSSHELSPTCRTMWEAVSLTGSTELTPMAAVAGTIADKTADWLFSQGATKVFVNNGGDIAMRLGPGEHVKVGIVPDLKTNQYSCRVNVTSNDRVGGIATSGLGGRSFTRGIADAVTVLAESCAVADAFATQLANSSWIESQAITQVKAATIDPDSDIADLDVTVQVGILTSTEIQRSLAKIEAYAKNAIAERKIQAFAAHLQGIKLAVPEIVFN